MLVVEVPTAMRTATKHETRAGTRIERLDEGDWLNRLLADVHDNVARQPSAGAIERMRGRVLAEIEQPIRAAA